VPEEFVPLETFLRPAPSEAKAPAVEPPVTVIPRDLEEVIRDARRFRAALADAVDIGVARLLPEIARGVLAREVRLAPADVAAVTAAALERFAVEEILTLRAHPADAEALEDARIPVSPDDALLPGDVVLELRSGSIDLRMETRLSSILGTAA
jgi:flagellar biosynthesis/type III secretory pathway protein FliH